MANPEFFFSDTLVNYLEVLLFIYFYIYSSKADQHNSHMLTHLCNFYIMKKLCSLCKNKQTKYCLVFKKWMHTCLCVTWICLFLCWCCRLSQLSQKHLTTILLV